MTKPERTRLIVLAVLLLVGLLVVGSIFQFRSTVSQANQQVVDLMHTQQAEAGQTAVREFQLTRAAP